MTESSLLLFVLVFLSFIYGKFVYARKTINGVINSLALLLSLYLAGSVYIRSNFYAPLIPFLVYYVTAVGYTAFLGIQQRIESLSPNEKPLNLTIRTIVALLFFLSWSVLALVLTYTSTNELLSSVTIFVGATIPLAHLDKRLLKYTFNTHLILVVIASSSIVLG